MIAQDIFVDQQNSPETRAMYRRWIDYFFDHVEKEYEDVNEGDLISFRQYVDSQDFKPATKVIIWKANRSFFAWLERTGRIRNSPFHAVKGFKRISDQRPRIPTDAQLEAVLNAVQPKTTNEFRDRAVVHLCANGLRISEVATLRSSAYFELDDGTPVVSVVGKGMKERLVPLAKPVHSAVEAWLRNRNGSVGEWLITDYTGHPLTTRQVRCAVGRAIAAAERETGASIDISAHSLRHHYATRLVRAGANLFAVQKVLGHASIQTTQIYVNLDDRDVIEAARLDPLSV